MKIYISIYIYTYTHTHILKCVGISSIMFFLHANYMGGGGAENAVGLNL